VSPTYEVTSNRWDQQNRLVRAILGTHESVYEYDGESRRVRIRELTSGVETKNESFVWCGSRICQKRSGATVSRNYFEQGFEEGTTDYFYTRDHLGSVREVVGSNGTTIASRLSYDPWGGVSETGSGALSDFGFTGHHFDRPTGLGLTWYRGYDPNLARWLSRDPIGLEGGANVYTYVANDGLNFVDPDGEAAAAAAAGGLAAGFGAALSLWAAWDCATNGCRGVKKLMDDLLGKPYCPTKDNDNEKEEEKRCEQVKDRCHDERCEPLLGTEGRVPGKQKGPRGGRGRRGGGTNPQYRYIACMQTCMAEDGCSY